MATASTTSTGTPTTAPTDTPTITLTDTSTTSTADNPTTNSDTPSSSSAEGTDSPGSTESISNTTSLTTSIDTSTLSTTSSALPTSSSSTSTQPLPSATPTTSAEVQVSTSGGVVVTRTSVIVTTPTPTSITASSSSTGAVRTKSFAENTGAVAAVSVVAGLIGLGLFFAAITFFIRRRKARKFDRDVDEAAREAAGAHAPAFDDDVYGNGSDATGAGYLAGVPTGYSDNSHGTYNQQPMDSHSGENYNMREMHNAGYDNYAGAGVHQARSASSHPESAMTSGLAGFGAQYGAYGASEHSSQPYPAFAHQYNPAQYNSNVGDYNVNDYPQANSNDYGNNDYVVNQNYDGGYAAAAAAATTAAVPQQDHNLNRQKSSARSLLDGNPSRSVAEPVPAESYASRYARSSPSNAAPSTAVHSDNHANRPLSSATSYGDDPYGGYDDADRAMPNPHSPSVQPPYTDIQDVDQGDGRRVLKVANE